MSNTPSFSSKENISAPSNLEKIVSKLPSKFRNLLLVLLASQLVLPKDASAEASADQIFAANLDQSNPIEAVVVKPDSLTPPTLSAQDSSSTQNSTDQKQDSNFNNSKSSSSLSYQSRRQNSKLNQIESITTENPVHNLDTILSINGSDNLSGFPGKLYVYDKLVDNDDYSISSWNNQGGNVKDWLVTGNGDTILCGANGSGWPAFKKLNDANWTQIAQTTGYGVNDLVGISNGPSTANIDWYLKGSNKLLKKTGTTGSLQEVLNLTGMNAITSNGTDTIYIAYGSQGGIRAYNVNNFSQYTDLKYNLPNGQIRSIDWKDGNLLVTCASKIFILRPGSTEWTQVTDLTGNQPMAVSWMEGEGASSLDFAVGCQLTSNNLFIYREVLAPSFTSATLTPSNPLVNPGVVSDTVKISCDLSNKPTEVHADLSSLGLSDSVALTKTDNDTWEVDGITFPNALPGQYSIPVIASNQKGQVTTNLNFTLNENGAPIWTNPVDTVFINEGELGTYTINSSDPNGHQVNTTYTNTPNFLSPNGSTISGTPGNSNVGVHSVSGRLVDQPFQDTTNVNFNVKVVNKAPEFTSNPPLFGNVGTPYSYTPTLQYHGNTPVQAVTLPPWASFTNGTLSGNPTFGTFPVVLRSDDGNGGVTDQAFEIIVNDANPFADSLAGNTNHLVSSPDSVFTVNLPKKYHNPNLTYQAFNIGTAVKSINFQDSADTLKVNVELKPGNQRTFRIRVLNGPQNQFESGFLTLNLDQGNLTMISAIQTFYSDPGDTVLTTISTGAPTTWKVINETDNNRVVNTSQESNIGIIDKNHIIDQTWLNNTDSLQTLKVEITNNVTGQVISRIIPVKKTLTSIKLEDLGLPKEFKLEQNYPNPFNPTTKIQYALPKEELVNLKIYNMLGQEIANPINNELQAPGHYEQDFDGSELASGTYIYVLTAGEFKVSKKMVLVK